jgi:hypothetical protein
MQDRRKLGTKFLVRKQLTTNSSSSGWFSAPACFPSFASSLLGRVGRIWKRFEATKENDPSV